MNLSKFNHITFIYFIFIQVILVTSSSLSYQNILSSEEQKNVLPQLSLYGVIVSEESSSSLAVLKNEKTGKIIFLKTGESIYDLKLIHVLKNRVMLQREKKPFLIFLGRNNLIGAGIISQNKTEKLHGTEQKDDRKVSDQLKDNFITREFKRSEIEKRIKAEWSNIMKETRFVPNQIDGKISGFKITKLPRNSILSEIGIYKNDIIKEINNIELNDVSNLFGLYNKFKYANQIEVLIERQRKLYRVLYILK